MLCGHLARAIRPDELEPGLGSCRLKVEPIPGDINPRRERLPLVPDNALGQGDHGPDRLRQRAQVADTLGKATPQIHQYVFRWQMVEDLAIEFAECSD